MNHVSAVVSPLAVAPACLRVSNSNAGSTYVNLISLMNVRLAPKTSSAPL